MKLSLAIATLGVAMASVGCGDTGTAIRVVEGDGYFAIVSGGRVSQRPKIDPPNRPPPKKVVFRDIEVGSGPMAHHGDRVSVHYVGFNYRTGKEQYPGRWPPDDPLVFSLGSHYVALSWEEALKGMREGGRREMIIPSRLLFSTGTIDYIVDMVAVKPAKSHKAAISSGDSA